MAIKAQSVTHAQVNTVPPLRVIRHPNEQKEARHLEGVDLEHIKQLLTSTINPQVYSKQNETITFDKYLDRVIENPKLIRTSVQRISDMIMERGREEAVIDDEVLFKYKFFTEPPNPELAIFGIEETLHKLVADINGAASESGPDERLLVLVGPVGSAKTNIAKLFKRGLEEYTAQDENALYRIEWDLNDEHGNPILKDLPTAFECEVYDDPLKLLPGEARKEVVRELNKTVKEGARAKNELVPYELKSAGDVCPQCNDIFRRLLQHYSGDVEKVLSHVKAKRLILDEKTRAGITEYEPSEEKSQDTKDLTGGINYRKLVTFGSESNPHVLGLDGELCKSNRGILQLDEIFKSKRDMQYTFLSAAQERAYKIKKTALISFDGLIIGTTNIPDWERVKRDKGLEALKDRTIVIPVPYNEKISHEVSIYDKLGFAEAEERGYHIAPHTKWLAAAWSVMTRLAEDPAGAIDLLQKARLYDGEPIKDYTTAQVVDMKKRVPKEENELLKGISPRIIQNTISAALNHPDVLGTESSHGTHCINPFLVRDYLGKDVDSDLAQFTAPERKKFTTLLNMVEAEIKDRIIKDLHKAIAGDEKAVANLFEDYKENVFASLAKEKVKDKLTGRMKDPDETLMRSIESKMDITDSGRKTHREWFTQQFVFAEARSTKFTYQTDQRVRKALEEELIQKQGNISTAIITINKATASQEQLEKIELVKSRLIHDFGYCEHCADIAMSLKQSPENKGATR